MASFEEILNKKASDIQPPAAFPVGTYHCIIDGPPKQEQSSQKKTDCRVYSYKIIAPMQDVDQAAAVEAQVVGKILSGQLLGTAWYITEDAVWRYKEFLIEHLGIEEGDKTLLQMEAEAPGRQLLVKLKHEASQDGKRVYHRVESTAHV